ncbi:hypothetical protein KDM41_18135 [bacterium]|nr:hypothetical protein [bacterium]
MKRYLVTVAVAGVLAWSGVVEACSGMIQLPEGTVSVGGLFYVDTDQYTVDKSADNLGGPSAKGQGLTQGKVVANTQGNTKGNVKGNGPLVEQGHIEVYEQHEDGLFYLVDYVTDIPVLGGDESPAATEEEEVADVPPPPPPPLFVPAPPGEFLLPFADPAAVAIPEEAAPLELETLVVIS